MGQLLEYCLFLKNDKFESLLNESNGKYLKKVYLLQQHILITQFSNLNVTHNIYKIYQIFFINNLNYKLIKMIFKSQYM